MKDCLGYKVLRTNSGYNLAAKKFASRGKTDAVAYNYQQQRQA